MRSVESRPFSWNSSSPPATRWNSKKIGYNCTLFFFGMEEITRFTLPHIAQHLNMTGDLFPGPLYAGLLEIIDKELVSPPRTAAREGGPGRFPVLAKTCGESVVRRRRVEGEGRWKYLG